jgi:hypothetical protein
MWTMVIEFNPLKGYGVRSIKGFEPVPLVSLKAVLAAGAKR